ncbi:MAG TPA: hypothetical protein DIV41_02260 [Ruminococcaceae bacterium]|jgi:hypothetical protein|nr:hypothetical protein [Oscillospiraceae bacterium]
MEKLKKFSAVLLAAVFIVSGTTACASDKKSWAAKNDSMTVPIGSYICYLYSEYNNASSQVTDSTKSVLSQKIDSKDATSWIREKALNDVKTLFVIDSKMKELNLKLDDTESKTISSAAASQWEQYGTQFEKWGVAQSSFSLSFYESSQKLAQIFYATYGNGGKKAVSDADLKSYYVKNYSDFSYISLPLYKSSSSGKVTAMTAAEKKKAESEFDGYIEKIKAGTMTMQQAADAYKTSSKSTSDQLQSDMANLSSSGYPDDMKKMISAMKSGEVKAQEISSGTTSFYVMVMKNDIDKTISDEVKDETKRKSLLYTYKYKEFSESISKEAEALKDVTVNDSALNSYDPSMFETDSSSSAS